MSAWKAAGLTYVRFSAVASGAMKRALNAEALGKFIIFFIDKDDNFLWFQDRTK